MRASSTLAPLLAALAAGVLLGACGGGLYDAAGVPVLGGGDVCDDTQISCGGKCTTPNPTQCGEACEDCTASVTAPANGVVACLGSGPASACGYQCTDASGASQGFLKCRDGCCGAAALAAGDRHTCALLALEGVPTGEVACWGANESGQIGTGTASAAVPAPHLVALGGAAVAVAAGPSHTCVVLAGGAVQCWGADGAGQVSGAAGAANAVEVAAGAAHTCARLATGAVTCWGSNASGQLGPGPGPPIATGASAISAGHDHACAVVGGAVRCWGANATWQLGATLSADGVGEPIAPGAQLIAASANQTCAGKPSNGASLDDALRCWGDAFGSTVPDDVAGWFLSSPQPTPAMPKRDLTRATIQNDVTLLAAGAHHVCAVVEGVSVECLGRNDSGQLGGALPLAEAGRTVTVVMPGTGAATALAAGAAHTCAAAGDGRLRCWGDNDKGQLGNNSLADPGVGVLATPLGR